MIIYVLGRFVRNEQYKIFQLKRNAQSYYSRATQQIASCCLFGDEIDTGYISLKHESIQCDIERVYLVFLCVSISR